MPPESLVAPHVPAGEISSASARPLSVSVTTSLPSAVTTPADPSCCPPGSAQSPSGGGPLWTPHLAATPSPLLRGARLPLNRQPPRAEVRPGRAVPTRWRGGAAWGRRRPSVRPSAGSRGGVGEAVSEPGGARAWRRPWKEAGRPRPAPRPPPPAVPPTRARRPQSDADPERGHGAPRRRRSRARSPRPATLELSCR